MKTRSVVVADTTPLNYLIVIGRDHLLEEMFGEVLALANLVRSI